MFSLLNKLFHKQDQLDIILVFSLQKIYSEYYFFFIKSNTQVHFKYFKIKLNELKMESYQSEKTLGIFHENPMETK